MPDGPTLPPAEDTPGAGSPDRAPVAPAVEGAGGGAAALDPGEAAGRPTATLTAGEVRRRNARDIAMLALGVVSLGIVAYDFLYRTTLTAAQVALLQWVDLGIVAVFAAEFVWRWRGDGWKPRFVLRNWFDLLGMVPLMVTDLPLFRAFRLLRIGMVASRLLRMWAFVTGQRSAQFVFDRYRAQLVEQVTDRVMLATLAMVEDVAARGGYTRAVGDSLARSREDVAEAVVRGAREGDAGKVLAAVPGAEAAVRQAARATVDSVVATLRSEELQRAFEASVRAVLDQTRQELARERWRERYAAPGPAGPGSAAPAARPMEPRPRD